MAKSSKEDIIKDEHRILEKLKNNANKSINEIAKECKFSRQKVWRIIKQLEKNRINKAKELYQIDTKIKTIKFKERLKKSKDCDQSICKYPLECFRCYNRFCLNLGYKCEYCKKCIKSNHIQNDLMRHNNELGQCSLIRILYSFNGCVRINKPLIIGSP